ncbi:hypothetical protein ABGB18_09450 [Nonomuraea sp. B12E4]|uniref:hypothetical protein n=1 Tax=Nonomuraea sp. B12E4 TaxID=3153564 RepID=UPI00325F649F
MYRRAVTAATVTAAALLLAAGPALADDDFAGPHRTPCASQEPRFLDFVAPMFAAANKAGCVLADTNESAGAHVWDEVPSEGAQVP